MVKQCNGQCDPECQEDKKSVYICLKSESHFLSSLLRLGHDKQGKQNLLGYDSSELIDWYLYAKRSFASWLIDDSFGFGLKLLDELAKILFGITHVTAKDPTNSKNGKFLLLQPLEQELVDAFLGSDFSSGTDQPLVISRTKKGGNGYSVKVSDVSFLRDVISNKLEAGKDIDFIRESYTKTLECRISFTRIQEIVAFRWNEYQTDVLLILRSLFDDENTSNRETVVLLRSARLKLACAYLHGVARFALSSPTSSDNTSAGNFGYWLDRIEGVSVDHGAQDNISSLPSSSGANQKHAPVPLPRDTKVRISCELAASLAQEYWQSLNKKNDSALFDVLFMCKEEDGWFWVLTDSQLQHLQDNVWRENATNLEKALGQFRFKHAGIIKHLERTECLIEEVYDFNKEKLICTAVGYQLESSREVFRDFESFENSLPGVDTGSYFYFRLSSHEKADNGKKKLLPEGSLVAVFRFDRELPLAKRLGPMELVRQLVERWRAKMDSLGTVTDVVRELSRPFQEKTARAAIMSRNLSHNVGSHSLANSRLFDAIGVLNEQSSAPPESKRTDPLLIDRRCVQKGEVWRARSRLGTLNSYLQGRMDFIAQALGESSSQPEPMFFINDLLRGFLSQSVLLNTLLSDSGYTAKDMKYCVTIKRIGKNDDGTNQVCFTGKTDDAKVRHVEFKPSGTFNDVLVAIPGGMIGRHAFFAFMENYLRNAAKYGAKARGNCKQPENIFEIHLLLEEYPPMRGAFQKGGAHDKRTFCYTLTLTDNLSIDKDGSAANRIRVHLDEDIVDGKGSAQTEGHGIQEMKVCARFLAGGEDDPLVFPSNDALGDAGSPLGKSYDDYLKKGDGVVKLKQSHSLTCFDKSSHLAYGLLFQQPRLLGIVCSELDQEANILTADKEPTVVFYRDIATLAQNPAYFGLILLESTEEEGIKRILEEIGDRHTALPFRLMLAVQEENNVSDVQLIVDTWQKDQADKWWANPKENNIIKPFPLPHNRVRVIACPQLFNSGIRTWESNKWHDCICDVYDKWLYAYKGHELPDDCKQWHLGIGFERSMKSVLENRWNVADSEKRIDLGFKADHLRLHLFTSEHIEEDRTKSNPRHHVDNEEGEYEKDLDDKDLLAVCNNKKCALALDNHGAVLSEIGENTTLLKDSIASYHPFSGSEQIMLFQLLDSPPRDAFARAFMVFSVAEALLTRIVVVDERLADATVEDNGKILRDKLLKLQKARIYPLYTVHSQKETDRVKPYEHFLSSTVETALSEVNAADQSEQNKEKYNIPVNFEGLHINPIDTVRPGNSPDNKPHICYGEQIVVPGSKVAGHAMSPVSGSEYPDFIVIHEGVTDILNKDGAWPDRVAHQELYTLCPAIIRTSGRGSISRHLGNQLPFLEFSELSDSTYRQMNKVALAKGLLSLRGSEGIRDDEDIS